jgi:hypothetical protein
MMMHMPQVAATQRLLKIAAAQAGGGSLMMMHNLDAGRRS